MVNFRDNTKVHMYCLIVGILLNILSGVAEGKTQLLSSSFAENDYGEIDTIFINSANQLKNQLQFIEAKIYPAIPNKNKFLDIGPGPGYVTERIARNFSETTVVEPIKDFEKKFRSRGYRTFIGNFQDIMLKDKYDFILCSHVLYHVKQNEWSYFLQKIYDSLEPNGIALIVLIAPKGSWAHLQHTIKPNYSNSKKVEQVLKKLGLRYKISLVRSNFKTSKQEDFIKIFRLFTIDNCFPPEEFDKLTAKQKLTVENKIKDFVDSCKTADGVYVANWDDAYIILSKSHIRVSAYGLTSNCQ